MTVPLVGRLTMRSIIMSTSCCNPPMQSRRAPLWHPLQSDCLWRSTIRGTRSRTAICSGQRSAHLVEHLDAIASYGFVFVGQVGDQQLNRRQSGFFANASINSILGTSSRRPMQASQVMTSKRMIVFPPSFHKAELSSSTTSCVTPVKGRRSAFVPAHSCNQSKRPNHNQRIRLQ